MKELDNRHRGKAIVYLERLMEANKTRSEAYCIVTNMRDMEVFKVQRDGGNVKIYMSTAVDIRQGRHESIAHPRPNELHPAVGAVQAQQGTRKRGNFFCMLSKCQPRSLAGPSQSSLHMERECRKLSVSWAWAQGLPCMSLRTARYISHVLSIHVLYLQVLCLCLVISM